MCCEVKLRTGYFKTTQYNMVIADNSILLASTADVEDEIRIGDIELIVVSSEGKSNPVIEIQSKDVIYSCILHKDIDLDAMLSTMRRELSARIGIFINDSAVGNRK